VTEPHRRRPALAWLVGTLIVLTGCSGQGNAENRNAEAAAVAFAATAKSSPGTACDKDKPLERLLDILDVTTTPAERRDTA
jgi:hypothetical protein